jgi:hypothetical protein
MYIMMKQVIDRFVHMFSLVSVLRPVVFVVHLMFDAMSQLRIIPRESNAVRHTRTARTREAHLFAAIAKRWFVDTLHLFTLHTHK